MKEKNQVVPDEVLSKEFLSWFKTEADVNKFQAGECSAFLPCDAVLSEGVMQYFLTT